MHEIITKTDINAGAETVWSILRDFEAYPDWNPFIRSIRGNMETEELLTVMIQPQGGKPMTFRPRVLAANPNKEFRWRGRFLFPGIFDGEHFFLLESRAGKQTRFTQGERFSGLLVPMLKSKLDQGTKAGFVAMNEALKIRAEAMRSRQE